MPPGFILVGSRLHLVFQYISFSASDFDLCIISVLDTKAVNAMKLPGMKDRRLFRDSAKILRDTELVTRSKKKQKKQKKYMTVASACYF